MQPWLNYTVAMVTAVMERTRKVWNMEKLYPDKESIMFSRC